MTNYGTIASTDGGDAVEFHTSGDVLIDEAGAGFIGTVAGGGGTLVFDSAAGAGTVSGLGGQFTGFGRYEVVSGAAWTVAGSIAAGATLENDGTITVDGGGFTESGGLSGIGTIGIANAGTVDLAGSVSGQTVEFRAGGGELDLAGTTGVTIGTFTAGDGIVLSGVSYQIGDTATYDASSHQIAVYGPGQAPVADIAVTGFTLAAGDTLSVVGDGGFVEIKEVVCFLRGTRILTERGEVAVEDLRPGMLVVTLSGRGPALKPVKWIGRRRLDAGRHQRPEEVHPIRITAGALGDAMPHRDLLVSPGHALYLAGVLIPANRLVDGQAVFQDRTISDIEYFHIELEQHDILLAEGLPAESYLDSGNRRFFENGAAVSLHAGPDEEPIAAARCVRLTNSGPEVRAVRRAMADRYAAVTAEPVLRSGGTA